MLLALTLSLPLVPSIKRSEPLKLLLLVTAFSICGLMLKGHAPLDTMNLLITAVLWRALLGDEWPHWKLRLTWLTNSLTSSLSRPVMPLPYSG